MAEFCAKWNTDIVKDPDVLAEWYSCAYKSYGSRFDSEKNGTYFKVYAPNAKSVRVVGDFNDWGKNVINDGYCSKDDYGNYSCFMPGLKEGTAYKYSIVGADGQTVLKADPFALMSELRPDTASIVYNDHDFDWEDSEFLSHRKNIDYKKKPVNIYEVHLGSWMMHPDGRLYTYKETAARLLPYIKEMGYTHVEIMPVAEHPLDASWGYQITGFYSITSRYGSPDDFKYFVNEMHKGGIGVIVDWVPSHFCNDIQGLRRFDGTWLFESDNAELRENQGWGTSNFDFSKPFVRSFMLSNAMYYFNIYHVDGLRADAVSNLLFADFCKEKTDGLKNKFGGYEKLEACEFVKILSCVTKYLAPGTLLFAEDSSSHPGFTELPENGGFGFDFKWNMGWMNDSLKYIEAEQDDKQKLNAKITFSTVYAFTEKYVLPLSHDEVVHGKKTLLDKCSGLYDSKFWQLRTYFLYYMTHPGKKLSFMGNEFAPFLEWRFYEELEWKMLQIPNHKAFSDYVKKLNNVYLDSPSLWEKDTDPDGFKWINGDDDGRHLLKYIRFGGNKADFSVVLCNFCGYYLYDVEIGIPRYADYEVVIDTMDKSFGGDSDITGTLMCPQNSGADNMKFSLNFKVLAPFQSIMLKPVFKKKQSNI